MIEPPPFKNTSKRALARCQAKVRYHDKKSAQTGINYFLRGHHRRGRPADLTTYCCSVCGGWHLTRLGASPKADKRRETLIRRLAHRFEVRERVRFMAARRAIDDLHHAEFLPEKRSRLAEVSEVIDPMHRDASAAEFSYFHPAWDFGVGPDLDRM